MFGVDGGRLHTHDGADLSFDFDPSKDEPRATAEAFMARHGLELKPNAREIVKALVAEMEKIRGKYP